MPSTRIPVDYILFDYDGTLANSTPAVEKFWTAKVDEHNETYPEHPLLEIESFLMSAHGTRTAETIKRHFPEHASDPDAVAKFEGVLAAEYGHLSIQIPGSAKLLQLLHVNNIKWAIVTSGSRAYFVVSFAKLLPGIERPDIFVTADDVTQGKPSPMGYLKGAADLTNNDPKGKQILVFEDAPVGIQAGIAAGFPVIGIATTFGKEELIKAGASYVIEDMTKVKVERNVIEIEYL